MLISIHVSISSLTPSILCCISAPWDVAVAILMLLKHWVLKSTGLGCWFAQYSNTHHLSPYPPAVTALFCSLYLEKGSETRSVMEKMEMGKSVRDFLSVLSSLLFQSILLSWIHRAEEGAAKEGNTLPEVTASVSYVDGLTLLSYTLPICLSTYLHQDVFVSLDNPIACFCKYEVHNHRQVHQLCMELN